MASETHGKDVPFVVPSDGKSFTRNVLQRCEDMIGTGIWDGMDVTRFRGWTNNFVTEEEQYLSARLLDRLHYRSPLQTKAMMKHLFQSVLPGIRPGLGNNEANHWIDRLSSKTDPGIRIVPVINQKDPPTKSGPLMCRLLKRSLGLNDHWMIWPEQIPKHHAKGIQHFFLVDDFLGTGYQFKKFLGRLDEISGEASPEYTYLTLTAYQRGLETIRKRSESLPIGYAELLDNTHNLFGPNANCFNDDANSRTSAIKFYKEMMSRKNVGVEDRMLFGYSKLSLAYAFEHATPNSTLPIFWASSGDLHPLFTR